MEIKATKVICIKETETILIKINGYQEIITKNKVKEFEFVCIGYESGKYCCLYKKDLMTLIGIIEIEYKNNFIPLAEWRDKQINSILDDN